MIEFTTSKKKLLKVPGDSQASKCFQEVQTSLSRRLLRNPQISLHQKINHKKTASLEIENFDTYKEICKELIKPGKLNK
jgi:hypothetical protein